MKLRAFLLIVPIVAAACGPSVNDVCSQYAEVWCQQQYSCKTGADLQTIQTKYGADVPTCTKVYSQELHCSSATIAPCPTGTSYDTSRGQLCATDYAKLQCTDIQQNTVLSECDISTICH